MSAIPFTDRELTHAWRELSAVAKSVPETTRKNSHRLLLLYAVECGLKAVWLKRQRRSLFAREDIKKLGHNLNQVLKDLNLGTQFSLPEHFQISPETHNGEPLQREGKLPELHQVWRYGGKCISPTDNDCEQQLEKVLTWIQGELK